MICEIINPSDPYSLETDDFLCAAIAIAVLGGGRLGLRSLDGEEQSPTLFGWDEWIQSHIGDEPTFQRYIQEHYLQMAGILDSVLIGYPATREDIEMAMSLIPDERARREYWAQYHDRHRSSMNDIGRAAKEMASRFRTLDAERKGASHATNL